MSKSGIPIVQFYRMIDETRPPQRADRSAAGTLPTRAYRYCEAVTSATGFGWWAFPPADLTFVWDGTCIFWQRTGEPDLCPLLPSAQFPGLAGQFDSAAPSELTGCSPPFLTALPEPGTLQIWTGLIARTAPGWHLLVRAPANLGNSGGYVLYEGIVETDRWFGPLFTNLRFTRSHSPVRLRADYPLLQLQPIQRPAYGEETLKSVSLTLSMSDFSETDWTDYRTTIAIPNADPDRPFGTYASDTRKRRRGGCPLAVGAVGAVDRST